MQTGRQVGGKRLPGDARAHCERNQEHDGTPLLFVPVRSPADPFLSPSGAFGSFSAEGSQVRRPRLLRRYAYSHPLALLRADQLLPAVIKRPMDLATLLKKVKQQSYRTKRAFAEDIDLIWSNCLLYNSHPVRPSSPCPSRFTDFFSFPRRLILSAPTPKLSARNRTNSSSSLPTLLLRSGTSSQRR